ncbi:MAG: hypothetical protein P4L90_25735 [Rhodopila sp.]|nr:hypothetical protein [Rhodopila sp.]
MLVSGLPYKFVTPWAASATTGYITPVIPATASGGNASQAVGFPPVTATNVSAGGIPPSVSDFNGFGLYVTEWLQWVQAGGPILYDATFSGNIGGYPKGAAIQAGVQRGAFWFSTVDNNTSDPDTGGANWSGAVTSIGYDSGGANLRFLDAGLSYGAMWRNDGTNVYLLFTNHAAAFGPFNGLRPYSVNLSTGYTIIDGTGSGVEFGGNVQIDGAETVNGTLTVRSQINANGGAAINGLAGRDRALFYQTSGVDRWLIDETSEPESGSNTGSNLAVGRYDDSGNFIDLVLKVLRSTGGVEFFHNVQFDTTATIGTGARGSGNPLRAVNLGDFSFASAGINILVREDPDGFILQILGTTVPWTAGTTTNTVVSLPITFTGNIISATGSFDGSAPQGNLSVSFNPQSPSQVLVTTNSVAASGSGNAGVVIWAVGYA